MAIQNGAAVPRIYVTDTNIKKELLQKLTETLPPRRAALAARLASPEASVLGFCLVRYALYAETGRVFNDDWQIADGGKPYLEGAPCFNLSHTAHGVAVAVFKDEIGIDIEQVRAHHPRLAERICSDAEREILLTSNDPTAMLIQIWSAKEAKGKCLGTGLENPKSISLAGTASTSLSIGGVPHVLSLSPATEMPSISRVTPEQILLLKGKLS